MAFLLAIYPQPAHALGMLSDNSFASLLPSLFLLMPCPLFLLPFLLAAVLPWSLGVERILALEFNRFGVRSQLLLLFV